MKVTTVLGLFWVVMFLTLAPRAFAHDGHGTPLLAGSELHYLLEPAHFLSALLVAGTVALAARSVSKRRRRAASARHR